MPLTRKRNLRFLIHALLYDSAIFLYTYEVIILKHAYNNRNLMHDHQVNCYIWRH
jgi:hypothetical protein